MNGSDATRVCGALFKYGAGLLLLVTSAARAAAPLPDPSEVKVRLVERAQEVAQADESSEYTYQSHSRLEALDADEEIVRTEEKVYHVRWVAGLPVKRLLEVKGKELSAEELAEEQLREERFQEKFTDKNTRRMAARKQSLVTQALLDRYHFVVQERVFMHGRPTLVVDFAAKAHPESSSSLQDRILNRLAGTLCIDEEEADTAKVQIRMVEPLSIGWLGILGSVTTCEFRVDRLRMPDGVWLNEELNLHIHLRKLAHVMRFRKTETSKNIQKANLAALSEVAANQTELREPATTSAEFPDTSTRSEESSPDDSSTQAEN